MTHQYTVTGMTCTGCATTVQKALQKIKGVEKVKIDLGKNEAEVTMDHHIATSQLQGALAGYPNYELHEPGSLAADTQRSKGNAQVLSPLPKIASHQRDLSVSPAEPYESRRTSHVAQQPGLFDWSDTSVWRRASFNTLNCLIGCSIGDFAMIIFLQKYYPATSMSLQMILAIVAGLATSVAFESILLHAREKFAWGPAFKTALSMSFISMVAMEVVMNFTDFMITGGKAAFGNPMYWTALLVSMIAGFLAPLPYNYYKLKKYNQACH